MKHLRSFASNLSRKLVIFCAALFMVAIVIVTILSANMIRKDMENNATNSLNLALDDIEMMISDVSTPVENMVWLVKDHLDDPDYMFKITSQLVSANPLIMGSTVSFARNYFPEKGEYFAPYSCIDNDSGSLLSFQMGGPDYNYFSMDWYSRPAATGRPSWSEPYFDTGGGNQMMATYSVPIIDESNHVIGVITSDISLGDLTKRISEAEGMKDSFTLLISGSGAFLSNPDESHILDYTIFDEARTYNAPALETIGRKMISGEAGTSEFIGSAGKYFIAYGALSNGWSAGMACPYHTLFNGLFRIVLFSLLLMIAGLLAISIFVRKIIGRQSQPITEFAYTAQAIAKGNFKATIPEIESTEELMHLRQSFAYLEKSINTYIAELRSATGAKERLEGELGIARNIQLSMVPKVFPHDCGFDLKAEMHAAKEVGGDLFDYVVNDGKLIFAVGDVSGKGVPAALYMAIAKSAFHFLAKSSSDVTQVVSTVNSIFSEDNDTGMFATYFVGCVDLETLRMDYCNAGHNPIVVINPDGSAGYLKAKPNLAVGLFEDFPYVGESIQLARGSRILVYTDGVTEAERHDKSQYGEQRLLDYCGSVPVSTGSTDFLCGLLDSVHAFTEGNASNDDITVLTLLL